MRRRGLPFLALFPHHKHHVLIIFALLCPISLLLFPPLSTLLWMVLQQQLLRRIRDIAHGRIRQYERLPAAVSQTDLVSLNFNEHREGQDVSYKRSIIREMANTVE